MYYSSARGNFFKANVQNHYEKVRCDLYMKEVARRHVHSLANINKSIKDTRDTLKDIRANSGYCKEEREPKTNVWKEPEWKIEKSGRNQDNMKAQMRLKTSGFQEMNVDSSEETTVSRMTVDNVSRGLLFQEKSEGNILKQPEYSVNGRQGGEMNGGRSGRLPRDELLILPERRNVSGRGVKGTTKQGLDSTEIPESQGKPTTAGNGGQNIDTISDKRIGKYLGSITSRTADPPKSALESRKLGKYRPSTSQTAPEKVLHSKSHIKSTQENSRFRYFSSSDVRKVKIHVSISRTEKKRILQELIASCTVPCDRSVLERERQRQLQEKIHRFFELLFEQDDEEKKDDDDESDFFGDN